MKIKKLGIVAAAAIMGISVALQLLLLFKLAHIQMHSGVLSTVI